MTRLGNPAGFHRRRRKRRGPAFAIAAVLALAAPAPGAPAAVHLGLQLPRPDLGQMEVAARRQVEEQLARVESLLAEVERAPAELGRAVGRLGRLYHAYGFENAAVACYREAERLDPTAARWPYYQGFLHQVRGELRVATAALERALALGRDDPAVLIRLANAKLAQGETAVAERSFREALERHPSAAAAAHAGLAQIAERREQPAVAIEHYKAALSLQPEASRLHYPLAMAYRAIGDAENAREHLRLRGDTPVAFPDPLAAAIDSDAVGASLHLTRAGIALKEGRAEAAVVEYRLALATQPEDATARRELGMLLAARGDLEGARSELEVARALEPEEASHHEALARVVAAAGDEERAIELLRRAIELEPGRASSQLQLAAALARAGRYAAAEVSFNRVLELEPESPGAALGRAEVRLELGRYEEATADLESVLRSEPGNARAHLRLGEARQRLGQTEEALARFEAALGGELDPRARAAALLGAGNLLAARGDYDAAIERYREALGLAPGLAEAELNLAGALVMVGREEEAIERYGGVLARDPGNDAARLQRGQALLRRGRAEEGLADLGTVADRRPDWPAAELGVAAALEALGRIGEARLRLESARARLPRSVPVAHALARLLAAGPDPALRDGERALELALAVVAADSSPAHAETLAMALAAAGRFQEAVDWQLEILAQARAAGVAPSVIASLEDNLARYRAGAPCCAEEGGPGAR